MRRIKDRERKWVEQDRSGFGEAHTFDAAFVGSHVMSYCGIVIHFTSIRNAGTRMQNLTDFQTRDLTFEADFLQRGGG